MHWPALLLWVLAALWATEFAGRSRGGPLLYVVALAPLATVVTTAVGEAGGAHPFFVREGPAEWWTEGVLVALAARAAFAREPLLALGAALYFFEEIDWAQRWIGFETPSFLAGSRSDRMNLHNLPPWDGLWRTVPALAVLVGGLPETRRWASALALPRFSRSAGPTILLLGAAALLARLGFGALGVDEVAEAAAVTLVALSWRPRVAAA